MRFYVEEQMKLLLCSDFSGVGYSYLERFFGELKGLKCLFVGYADEDEFPLESSSAKRFLEKGIDVDVLDENYAFESRIDMIFVRGGNTTRLIHFLKKYNQFEKIKQLVLEGALYIGNSAGSVLAGSDTEWTLRSEPYDVDLKILFGKDALKGFGFVSKMIFVHCSKYRLPFDEEIKNAKIANFKVKNTLFYNDYLTDTKIYCKQDYITLKNNEVYFMNDKLCKILKKNWSKLPVRDEFRMF